jgi:hypothetical protein
MTEAARRIGTLGDDDLDPDLAPVAPAERTTSLDTLLSDLDKALTADVTFEPLTLAVVKRPGVSIRYRTDLDDEKLEAFRKRAQDRKAVDGVNGLRFCTLIVANQCEAIQMHGQDVVDEAGQNMTFGHKWIRDKYSAQRAADAVRKLIGSDPHVMLHANAIMEAAGFGDQAVEVDEEGPTTAS